MNLLKLDPVIVFVVLLAISLSAFGLFLVWNINDRKANPAPTRSQEVFRSEDGTKCQAISYMAYGRSSYRLVCTTASGGIAVHSL